MDDTHNSTLQGQGGGGWGQKPTLKKKKQTVTPNLSSEALLPSLMSF